MPVLLWAIETYSRRWLGSWLRLESFASVRIVFILTKMFMISLLVTEYGLREALQTFPDRADDVVE